LACVSACFERELKVGRFAAAYQLAVSNPAANQQSYLHRQEVLTDVLPNRLEVGDAWIRPGISCDCIRPRAVEYGTNAGTGALQPTFQRYRDFVQPVTA
jgi:hypothetical protein